MSDQPTTCAAVDDSLDEVGVYLNEIAAQVTTTLEYLKRVLEPYLDSLTDRPDAQLGDLRDEWNIATAGLFGPTGVIGSLARAMNLNWDNYTDAQWSDPTHPHHRS